MDPGTNLRLPPIEAADKTPKIHSRASGKSTSSNSEIPTWLIYATFLKRFPNRYSRSRYHQMSLMFPQRPQLPASPQGVTWHRLQPAFTPDRHCHTPSG